MKGVSSKPSAKHIYSHSCTNFFAFWVRDLKIWLHTCLFFWILLSCAKFELDWTNLILNIWFEFWLDSESKKNLKGNFAQFSSMKNKLVAKFWGISASQKTKNWRNYVFSEGLEDNPFRSSVSRSAIFFLIISLVLRPKYLLQIDKGGLPFRIFRGVQSLMLSNGQKRNLSSFRQRWWSVKNWFVQNKRTCIACYLLLFIVIFL